MLTPITHILPLTTVVRRRLLPVDGNVLAKIGQKVEPTDVVAETIVGRKHLIMDIAQELRVSPRQAAALIKLKRGQKVNEDELIAETTGLFRREVKVPTEGRIAAMGGGKLILETGGSEVKLLAGMPGVVTEIIKDRGVAIRASGSVTQGVWGNGQIDTGVMMSILDHPDDPFDVERLDVSIRSSIILGGYVDSPTVLKIASELPVRGLILSSMSPALIPLASRMTYPIMLINGFGRQAMDASAYKLLTTNARRDITLSAVPYDRFYGSRPEIFIALPYSQEPAEAHELEAFAPGQTVRIISLTRPARIGTLIQILPSQVTLPNGLRVKPAEVKLESGEQYLVPLTNLEVVG
ncbi:MAG TPA: hypothetical protein VGK00_08290 [Anaerolineales bacterium]|jgi:hypothetical protein